MKEEPNLIQSHSSQPKKKKETNPTDWVEVPAPAARIFSDTFQLGLK
jgi:hypothetical protein